MSECDDYESLPSSTTATTHMLAGAAAGIMEHCVMYPVDCVKVCLYDGSSYLLSSRRIMAMICSSKTYFVNDVVTLLIRCY